MTVRFAVLAARSEYLYRNRARVVVTLIALAVVLSGCGTSTRLEPRFDPNIDYGQVEAGSILRLEVEVVPAGAPPAPFTIEWSVDPPDVGAAPASSLRALPGEPHAVEYRPPIDTLVPPDVGSAPAPSLRALPGEPHAVLYRPSVDTRGPVVVRAELRNEDCDGAGPATRRCAAEFRLRVVAPGPPTLSVFIGGNALGEFLLEWTAPGTEVVRWQYRHRRKFQLTETGLRQLAPWGDWVSVPHGDGDTRSHRVTGLPGPGLTHVFQVRGWTATGAGTTYDPVEAIAASVVTAGLVQAPVGELLESGRRIASGACSFVVPAGMRVEIPWTTHIGQQLRRRTRVRVGRRNERLLDADQFRHVQGRRQMGHQHRA